MSEQAPDATRWQGYTHKELYRLLHEGAGPGASAEPSRRWAGLAGTLTDVGQDLQTAIDRSGSGWTGRAAGNAYSRLSELVGWAQQTATSAGEMRKSVESQAGHLAKARADMPAPQDAPPVAADPTTAPALQVISATTDKESAEAAAAGGEQRAFEVMATYQLNSDTTTGAMAAFSAPAELLGSTDIHRHRGSGITLTTPVLSIGLDVTPPQDHEAHDHDRGHGRHGDHGRGDWTSGAAAEADFVRRPLAAPSSFTVAAPMNEPLFGLTPIGAGDDHFTGGGRGGGSGSGRGGATAAPGMPTTAGPSGSSGPSGPAIGTAAGSGPHAADFQSAAAGQAAAAAGTPAAATPGAAAGTGLAGGTAQDAGKGALRRFGSEAIGSGQWFGDEPNYEVRGANSPPRRRFSDDEHVTEAVSIDGEEHRLPPTVIGE